MRVPALLHCDHLNLYTTKESYNRCVAQERAGDRNCQTKESRGKGFYQCRADVGSEYPRDYCPRTSERADRFPALQVVGALGVALRLPVHDNEIGFDLAVGRQNDRAVPRAIAGFDSFGEVDFFRLGIGHG